MQRKITYKCDNCGVEFVNSLDCQTHEKSCHNRKYLSEQLKIRLRNYIKLIEKQGFDVSINYDSTTNTNVCLIAIIDSRTRKRR